MPFIQAKIEGSVGTICLDHFEKRNALSAALVEAMLNALENFAGERVRAVILRAMPGVKIWSAGHDVDELPEARRDPLGWYDPLRRLIRAIEIASGAGHRHDRGRRLGRGVRSGDGLRHHRRRRERDLRPHARRNSACPTTSRAC